ncbi:MAG: hypothetical protein AAGA20_24400, partial [Planctomycetota bacterium]
LVREALAAATPDAFVTTTDEEVAFWAPRAGDLGLDLRRPTTGRTSGLVGDVVRICRLRIRS